MYLLGKPIYICLFLQAMFNEAHFAPSYVDVYQRKYNTETQSSHLCCPESSLSLDFVRFTAALQGCLFAQNFQESAPSDFH
jgi:hypothetical protein